MGYTIIKSGFSGVMGIMVFSILISPFFCYSIAQDNPEIACNLEYNIDILLRVYFNIYFPLLLIFGFILGAMLGRFYNLVEERRSGLERDLEKYESKKRKFFWMWEKRQD